MKVRELIEKLQTLDQEKNIWVNYDLYELQEPDFRPYDASDMEFYGEKPKDFDEGDYVHEAY